MHREGSGTVRCVDIDDVVHGTGDQTEHWTWCGRQRHAWQDRGGYAGHWVSRMYDVPVDKPITCMECLASARAGA